MTNVNSDYLFYLRSHGRTVDSVENSKEELDFFVGLFQMDLAFSETWIQFRNSFFLLLNIGLSADYGDKSKCIQGIPEDLAMLSIKSKICAGCHCMLH